MANNIENEVDRLTSVFRDMVDQFSAQANISRNESSIRVGLMFLYFWAYGKKNEKIKLLLKNESHEILKKVGNFFEDAEKDYENLKIERPELISLFENLSDDGYNKLISFIQSEIKSSLNTNKIEDKNE